MGFNSWGLWALEHGLRRWGTLGLVAPRHVASSWIRDPTMSSALAGRFFTTMNHQGRPASLFITKFRNVFKHMYSAQSPYWTLWMNQRGIRCSPCFPGPKKISLRAQNNYYKTKVNNYNPKQTQTWVQTPALPLISFVTLNSHLTSLYIYFLTCETEQPGKIITRFRIATACKGPGTR